MMRYISLLALVVSFAVGLGRDSAESTLPFKGSLGWLGMTYFEAIKMNDPKKLRQCWPTVEEIARQWPPKGTETDKKYKQLRDGYLKQFESLRAELPELARKIRASGAEKGIVWEKAVYHSMTATVHHRVWNTPVYRDPEGVHSMPDATIYFACPGIEGTMYSLKTDDGARFPTGWRFGDRPSTIVEKAGRLPYPR